MTDASAIREITLSRCRGAAGYIRDINANTNWRRNHQEKAEQAWLQMRVPLKASKMYPDIFAWMQLFNNDSSVRTRFPFLVLNGPSRMGKTRYASQLFGIAKTLVLSCPGVLAPNLKPFQRHEHSCIVFDEGSRDMVFRNKQVFQAGVDVVMLGQSNPSQTRLILGQSSYLAVSCLLWFIVLCRERPLFHGQGWHRPQLSWILQPVSHKRAN